MRPVLIALSLLFAPLVSAQASDHLGVGIGVGVALPGIRIGINVPTFPELVQVPGHPVYYDPRASSNYFFADGLYWVLSDDRWYSSEWYDGPWQLVAPAYVPAVVLRVPVRYYRHPPRYFAGWYPDAPPRWGAHWGRGWERQRSGWDRWDRHVAVRPAPLPVYQRQYAGDRYPRAWEQQRAIRSGYERGRSHDRVIPPGHGGRDHDGARVRNQDPRGGRDVRVDRGGRGRSGDDDRGHDRGHGRGRDRDERRGGGR